MAHKTAIKEDAFIVYAACESYAETARQMRQRHPEECSRIKRQTIESWFHKFMWQERLDSIKAKMQLQNNDKVIGELVNTLNDLKEIRQKLVRDIKADAIEFKSAEGMLNCLIGINKQIMEFSGDGPGGKINIEKMVAIVFNVLNEDPKLSQIVAEKQAVIIDTVRKKLKEVGA